jgi:hypothetical protein
MKKFFMVLAILGTLASLALLLLSPISINLDKRIPVAIGAADALLLFLLLLARRRLGEWHALAFALAGVILGFGTYSVLTYPWPSPQADRMLRDIQQIEQREQKSP